jgi:hypothetical protein
MGFFITVLAILHVRDRHDIGNQSLLSGNEKLTKTLETSVDTCTSLGLINRLSLPCRRRSLPASGPQSWHNLQDSSPRVAFKYPQTLPHLPSFKLTRMSPANSVVHWKKCVCGKRRLIGRGDRDSGPISAPVTIQLSLVYWRRWLATCHLHCHVVFKALHDMPRQH